MDVKTFVMNCPPEAIEPLRNLLPKYVFNSKNSL